MREFRVFLIGCPEPAVLRADGTSVEEIADLAVRRRYLSGALISADGAEDPTMVAIPTARIQMIAEA